MKNSLVKIWWGIITLSFITFSILISKTFFFHDEWTFINNILDSPIKFIFTSHNGHFWPLFALIYYIEFKLFQFSYFPYQIILLLFHFINIYLLYKIVILITGNKVTAFLSSVFFLFNSIYWEVLFSTSTLPTILCLLFINLFIVTYINFNKSKKYKFLLLSGLALIFASLCWGAGLFFPLIISFGLVLNVLIQKKLQWKVVGFYLVTQIIIYSIYYFFAHSSSLGYINLSKTLIFTFSAIKWLLVSFYTSSPGFINLFLLITICIAASIIFIFRKKKNQILLNKSLKINSFWLILSLSSIGYFYLISAISRYKIDMKLAYSSRYTYLPLFFLIMFNAIVFVSLEPLVPKIMKKVLFLIVILLILANGYFFNIYYKSWTESISLPNKKLFNKIIKTKSKEERSKIFVPSTFHDSYDTEKIYFIYLNSL